MKHKFYLLLILSIILCSLSFPGLTLAQDQRKDAPASRQASGAAHKSLSSENGPIARNSTITFSNSTGDNFDQYLFRDDVPGGRSKFTVNITTEYCPAMTFDGQGLLTNANELIQKGLLPATANLRLRVYDVDHNSTADDNGDGIPDPEIDYVYLNGKQIQQAGRAWTLSSGNNTWSTPSINVPIDYLKFPTAEGQEAINQIEIEIDILDVGWAIECSDIHISFEEPSCVGTPIVLINGLFGNQDTWNTFSAWLTRDNIVHKVIAVSGTASMATNATMIRQGIEQTLSETGASQVHIVAHSKGGLDTREYLRRYGTSKVDQVVQLGTPNHGTLLADGGMALDIASRLALLYYGRSLQLTPWVPAIQDLTTLHMHGYNYFEAGGEYFAKRLGDYEKRNDISILAGTSGAWYSDFILPNPNDGAVTLASATLPWDCPNYDGLYTVQENCRANDGVYPVTHADLHEDPAVYNRVLDLLGLDALANRPSLQARPTITPPMVSYRPASSAYTPQWISLDSVALNASASSTQAILLSSDSALTITAIGLADFDLTITDPDGNQFASNYSGYEKTASQLATQVSFRLENPVAGTWSLRYISAGEATTIYPSAIAYLAETLSLTAKEVALVRDVIQVEARVESGGTAIAGADIVGEILFADGSTQSLSLTDDGQGADATAQDGIYTGTYSPNQAGYQGLSVSYTNTTGMEIVEQNPLLVMAPTAQLGETYTDRIVDEDLDGLYDYLEIDVPVNVTESGDYRISASLESSNGEFISQTSTLADALPSGAQTVTLRFPGADIGNYGLDGPYAIGALSVGHDSLSVPLDEQISAHTTSAHAVANFPRPSFRLVKVLSETPVDMNGNGKYDYLDLEVEFILASSGYYKMSGQLKDQLQNTLDWTQGNTYLEEGREVITFRFDGLALHRQGFDGPYTFSDLSFYNSNANNFSVFEEVVETSNYGYDEFEGLEINGQVINGLTGEPATGALVLLSGPRPEGITLDSTGTFRFGGLTARTTSIQVTDSGFCTPQRFYQYLENDTTLEFRLFQSEYPNAAYLATPNDSLQLAPTEVNSVSTIQVPVVNTGCETLYLYNSYIDHSEFRVNTPLPATLYTQDTLWLEVSFSPSQIGMAEATLTLQNNGLTAPEIKLSANACRPLALEVLSDSLARCGPGEITFEVSAEADALQWATKEEIIIPGLTDQSWTMANLTRDTTFLVRATGSEGCYTPFQEISAHILPVPESIAALATEPFCGPGDTKLEVLGSAPYYEWYDESGEAYTTTTVPSISFTDTTGTFNFKVQARNEFGCTSDPITVSTEIFPSPETPEISDTRVNSRIVLVSSAPTGNQWYKDGEFLVGETESTLAISYGGLYHVEVTNDYQCTVASRPTTVTGLTADEMETWLQVFPNPVNTQLTLLLSSQGSENISQIRLISPLGQDLKNWEITPQSQNRVSVEVHQLPAGYYGLLITDKEGRMGIIQVIVQ